MRRLREPLPRYFRRHVEEQREIRIAVRVHASLELAQEFSRDEMAAALVGVGRVGEAIAQHPIAARERRFDDLHDVLAARREHQQRLGFVRHRLREQQLAQRFAERRAAGLARADDAMAAFGERVGEPSRMRALAGAVDAFEGDEAPANGMIGHEIVRVAWRRREEEKRTLPSALLIF
jgi:hypothetical protein